MLTTYHVLKLCFQGEEPPNKPLFQHQDFFLSPNGRVVGWGKSIAHLASKKLAEEFAATYLPLLVKRYGPEVTIEVGELNSIENHERLAERIAADSELVLKRIRSGILASNVKP